MVYTFDFTEEVYILLYLDAYIVYTICLYTQLELIYSGILMCILRMTIRLWRVYILRWSCYTLIYRWFFMYTSIGFLRVLLNVLVSQIVYGIYT